METLFFSSLMVSPAAAQTWSPAKPNVVVDATSIEGKVLFGYQGWFNCPMNGSGSWTHWSRGVPTATNLTVDLFPDLSDFKATDLCAAGSLQAGGSQAYLFSSRTPAVVDTHFRWMEQYGLDGVLVQRFIGEAAGKRNGGDVVLKNIIAAAAAHGRVFAIEYDLTGASETGFAAALQADWKYMVDDLKVTSHPNYLHHKGLPVVSMWGPGINDGGHNPKDPAALLNFVTWFKTTGPIAYRAFYMGGTPAGWSTGTGDSYGGAAWNSAFAAMDVVQPWTVGRYQDTSAAKGWSKSHIAPDVAKAKANGQLYMPVAFPGFSWFNLHQGRQNQIPRLGGKFLWSQAYGAKMGGASMLKFAMFDEVDEGTAMFKVVSKRAQAPDQGFWLTLDADGQNLPSDWYLRLAGEITLMFHGQRPVTPSMPTEPLLPSALRPGGTRESLGYVRTPGGFEIHGGSGTAGQGRVGIFHASGRCLRTLEMKDGIAAWDGKDALGMALPAGVYLAHAEGAASAALMLE